jgi:hypothetical protein
MKNYLFLLHSAFIILPYTFLHAAHRASVWPDFDPSMRRKKMRSATYQLGALVIAALLVLAGTISADEKKDAGEEKVALDKVPKAVLDAFKAKFPGAKITGAAKEKDDQGKDMFELAFTYKDYKYEAELQPDGTFIAIDKQIEFKELPKPVASTLDEKFPKATYKIIEEVTKKNKVEYYEIALVTAANESMEVLVDPSGKLLKEEKVKKK